MTWEERAGEVLAIHLCLSPQPPCAIHTEDAKSLVIAIRPIVEKEIAEMRRELAESLGRDALRHLELWEQEAQRAEQAEAHADALIAAITVRGSWPAVREVLNAARQWKAERDD